MKKTVTKEEVERVALKHINGVIVDKIINELFPPEFNPKEGEWIVKKWEDGDVDIIHLTKKAGYCLYSQDYYVRNKKHDLTKEAGLIDVKQMIEDIRIKLRHATPEEIATAEWEEGKPYKVWFVDGCAVRVSANKVGHFYVGGSFEGESVKQDKYEKL